MTTILLLFLLGIVLLFLDVFVPGVVLSFLGAGAILAGTAKAFALFGVGGGLMTFIVGAVLVTLAMYIEYGLLPKTSVGRKFFLHSAVEGTSQPAAEVALIGSEGIVVTPLVPTGQIEVAGRRHEAISLDGRVPAGVRVKVTGKQNFSLTVTKLS